MSPEGSRSRAWEMAQQQVEALAAKLTTVAPSNGGKKELSHKLSSGHPSHPHVYHGTHSINKCDKNYFKESVILCSTVHIYSYISIF